MKQSFSYWELQTWFSHVDFTIVGSGITGLNCALQLRKKYPLSKILVLERGSLPSGASTKNAGFACFGSLSEILSDLKAHTEDEVLQIIKMRYDGLNLLRATLGDKAIDYNQRGGYELFFERNKDLYEACFDQMESVNKLLSSIFNEEAFAVAENKFSFKNIQPKLIFNTTEGQINTGSMMQALLRLAQVNNILILNNQTVESFEDFGNTVEIKTQDLSFKTRKLFIATNGLSSKLGLPEVEAARSQILVTKPIKNLQIKGTFHLDEGYLYFRNIDGRILLGGGRNIDKKTENTDVFETTAIIQEYLDDLLKNTIIPNHEYEIDHRWSGIMGVGDKKKPILKEMSENVFCGIRLSGIGVAIGSLVGKELADFA
ncbi:MAG: FAD-dependent oxidoreductase [Leeuwenhoekiella sp.]